MSPYFEGSGLQIFRNWRRAFRSGFGFIGQLLLRVLG
jgi:hypothetical protein